MRKIDKAQDPKDHRVAQSDERVDRTLSQPVNELLKKFDHRAAMIMGSPRNSLHAPINRIQWVFARD
jgi:hypothetical protein